MTLELIQRHPLLAGEQVHAHLQRRHGGVQVGAHQVGQGQPGLRRPHKEGTAAVHTGNGLAGIAVEGRQASAVRVALQRLTVKQAVQHRFVQPGPGRLQGFPENSDPGVQIAGAGVAVNHGHWCAGGGDHHVNGLINPGEGPLQHRHGKDGGARGYVPGPGSHGVGGRHARSGVPLRGAERNAGGQESPQKGRSPGGQDAGVLPRSEGLRQEGLEAEGTAPPGGQGVEPLQQVLAVCQSIAVDGEHAAGVADAQDVDAGEAVVDISRQGGDMGRLAYVGFAVQNGLIEMGRAPALGNVEGKRLRQLCRRSGGGVAPGAEGGEQVPVPVKGQIPVHHAGDPHDGWLPPGQFR